MSERQIRLDQSGVSLCLILRLIFLSEELDRLIIVDLLNHLLIL